MNNTVIKVDNLSKRYQLGTIGYGSLQHDLRAWWARARGKEDPNSTVGERSRLSREGDFWALRHLSFSLERGDRLGIIGRNGAGKSTFLKILSRVTTPTAGSIGVRGRVASLLEVGTGFHAELTGRENVFLNGAILGMRRQEIQRKFDEIVEFSGVSDFIDTPVKRYSSGMYVRLAFSVAAHLDSDIMIIDEVLAVGDAEYQKKCIRKMEEVSKSEGRTILFVSHSITSVAKLCTKGIVLNAGQLAFSGSVNDALSTYSELFPLTRDGKILTDDANQLRNSGEIKLHELSLLRVAKGNQVTIGERFQVQLKFSLRERVEGLAVYVGIKDRFLPSTITNVTHSLAHLDLPLHQDVNVVLTLSTESMRPGLYPLYVWIGDYDRRQLPAGARTVADEVIGPLKLVLEDGYVTNYSEDDEAGVFSIASEVDVQITR